MKPSLAENADLGHVVMLWLARLPFLGVEELSSLLGHDAERVAAALRLLEQLGWVCRTRPQSPEFEEARLLFHLSDRAVASLSQSPAKSLFRQLPIGPLETAHRLVRIETVVGLNHLLTGLAATVAGSKGGLELIDLRSLPWARGRQRWWPHSVEAYGCVGTPNHVASFFVAWDRAGVPAQHRTRRAAAWYSFSDNGESGTESAYLLVCPSHDEAEQWTRAVEAAAERRHIAPLPVAWATTGEVLAGDPSRPIWRRLGSTRPAPLLERITWRSRTAFASPAASQLSCLGDDWHAAIHSEVQGALLSRRRASKRRGIPAAEFALSGSAEHKRALEWLGHHALLSSADLAVLLKLREISVQRLIDDLTRWGLVETVLRPETVAGAVPRFVLSDRGAEILAMRDGVPTRRYARYGVCAAGGGADGKPDRLAGFLRHLDHTIEANSFFIRLAAVAEASGFRLRVWLGPPECDLAFRFAEKTRWLRPDGYGELSWSGGTHRFFLEWDRGTVRTNDLRTKFDAYAMRAAALGEHHQTPETLIVTTSPQREETIRLLWTQAAHKRGVDRLPLKTATSKLLEVKEVLGAAWRGEVVNVRKKWPV